MNAVEEVVVLDFDRKFIDLAANSGETNPIVTKNKIFTGKSEEKDINTTPMAHALSLPFEEESTEQETVYQPAKRRESRDGRIWVSFLSIRTALGFVTDDRRH